MKEIRDPNPFLSISPEKQRKRSRSKSPLKRLKEDATFSEPEEKPKKLLSKQKLSKSKGIRKGRPQYPLGLKAFNKKLKQTSGTVN